MKTIIFRNMKQWAIFVSIVTVIFVTLQRFWTSYRTASSYYERNRLIGNIIEHPMMVETVSKESLSPSIISAATTNSSNTSSSILSGPLCIYAENRGWGNSLFAVLTFLSQAAEIKQQQQTMGFIDLRNGVSCHHRDNATAVHCVNYSFPCIFVEDEESSSSSRTSSDSVTKNSSASLPASLGSVYVNLFVHMHACPNVPDIYNTTSCRKRIGQRKNVHELTIARTTIHHYRHYLPHLFQLNATHIEYLLQSTQSKLTLEQLQHSNICAMQFRFGDYWFREHDQRNLTHHKATNRNKPFKPDKRLCQEYDKDTSTTHNSNLGHHPTDNITKCFQQQATVLLQEACPDPSLPIYLATDWDAFAQYMCQNYQISSSSSSTPPAISKAYDVENNHSLKRIFLSHCPSASSSSILLEYNTPNEHIHDVNLHSDTGRNILHHMLVDWLVLALSQSSPLRKQHFVQKRAYINNNNNHNKSPRPTLFFHSVLSEKQRGTSHVTTDSTKTYNYTILSYGSTFAETADLNWIV